jgi:hypothetical protein
MSIPSQESKTFLLLSWLGIDISLTLLAWYRHFSYSPGLAYTFLLLSWLGIDISLTLLAWYRHPSQESKRNVYTKPGE